MSSEQLKDILDTACLIDRESDLGKEMLTSHVVGQLRSALQSIIINDSMRRNKELTTFSLKESTTFESKIDEINEENTRLVSFSRLLFELYKAYCFF